MQHDVLLIVAISDIVFTTLAFLMLILVSIKTGVWYPSNNPQSPTDINRERLVEIIRVGKKVPPIQERHPSCRSECVQVIEVDIISKLAESCDASSSTEEISTVNSESLSPDLVLNLSLEHEEPLARFAAISRSFKGFERVEFTSDQCPSLSYAARKGYPYLLFVTITLITGGTFAVICVIGLDVSNHTLVLLPLVILFYNLCSLVSLSVSVVSHYLVAFIVIFLGIAMAFTTTIDLWNTSTWEYRTVMLIVDVLLVMLGLLTSKSWAFEWILIWLLITWSPIFFIFRLL